MNDEADRKDLGPIMLVGSVPLATVDDVFRECGSAIGEWLSFMPDGEVGERAGWTMYLHTQVFSQCPDLERASRPAVDNQDAPPQHDHHWDAALVDPAEFDTYRIREGVSRPRFGDMYFGGVAAESYQQFVARRADGDIPEHVRFQVCVPGTSSAIEEHFLDPADWPAAKLAYRDAIADELGRLLEVIPAGDLAIQLDMAWEVVDLSLREAPTFPWSPMRSVQQKLATHVEGVAQLTDLVPDDVVLGLHWCYGTWGGWPMNAMTDMRLCTDLTLEVIDATTRGIDYVHMPVAEDARAGFFDALSDLASSRCKVYLGMIHHSDGIEGFRKRWELARRQLPDAGVAGVCGFGRLEGSVVALTLALHRECALDVLDRADR